MYEHLRGKTLLIVGSDISNIAIIETAQELGMYAIVVDGIVDRSKAPAKNIADEAWDIDYSNIDEIKKRAIERKIDGVFAGYSEYRVLAALKIAETVEIIPTTLARPIHLTIIFS